MCNIWQIYLKEHSKVSKEMRADELRQVLRENRLFLSALRHVGLTGGEPTIKPDIVELVKAFRDETPHASVGMQSNGLDPDLLKERLTRILSFYPDVSLAVSIDGIGGVHDCIRGISGAFDKAIESLEIAKSLGVKKMFTGMTLGNQNAHQIGEVYNLASRMGSEFCCFLTEKADFYNNQDIDCSLLPESRRKIIEALKEFGTHHYQMDKLRRRLEFGEARRLLCYSGHASLVLDPYAGVKPCVLRSETFGNLRKKTLLDILCGQSAGRIKETIKNCSCWCSCEVSSSTAIDLSDVLRWFFLQCRNRVGFVSHYIKRG